MDSSKHPSPEEKADNIIHGNVILLRQKAQLNNPDYIILTTDTDFSQLLGDVAQTAAGLSSFDRPRYFHFFWEANSFIEGWVPSQSTVDTTTLFGGCEYAFLWEGGNGQLKNYMDEKKRLEGYTSAIWRAGTQFWGYKGVLVSLMGNVPATIYMGSAFDQNTALLVPRDESDLGLLWQYCRSTDFCKNVRLVDQSLKVTTATLEKIPFDSSQWESNASNEYLIPKPFSDDPTQWIFHGHSAPSDEPLQVLVARLLGYRWPAELDPKMELSDEQREWVNKCDGLLKYVDEDGIVCIPSVRGEETADGRLFKLLSAAYESGRGFQPLETQRQDAAGTLPTTAYLDEWLRDHFFEQHCKLFHHRPFIWHIWDGRRRDGFHALVNYHKLAEGNGKGRQLLESLTYSYLGDWIARQKEGVKRGERGAEDRLAAALELQKRLIAIIEGKPPFDIFVRWKPIEKQPIGWEPDINDGVRLNIRPFMAQDLPGGRKGAGILRWKPNIKWNKDRGKDVASAPWFPLFKGDRINDHHLSLEEKGGRMKDETGNG